MGSLLNTHTITNVYSILRFVPVSLWVRDSCRLSMKMGILSSLELSSTTKVTGTDPTRTPWTFVSSRHTTFDFDMSFVSVMMSTMSFVSLLY